VVAGATSDTTSACHRRDVESVSVVGELAKLRVSVSETSARNKAHSLGPAPRRSGPSWRGFIRQQAHSMIACHFFTVETASLSRI
jgi:hypothetical protein